MQAFASRQTGYSTSEFLAEAIFGAATDGSRRLKYVVGADAEAILATRAAVGDEKFVEGMAERMGLA